MTDKNINPTGWIDIAQAPEFIRMQAVGRKPRLGDLVVKIFQEFNGDLWAVEYNNPVVVAMRACKLPDRKMTTQQEAPTAPPAATISTATSPAEALALCAQQFREYERNHLAKDPPQHGKAAVNGQMAAMCEAVEKTAVEMEAALKGAWVMEHTTVTTSFGCQFCEAHAVSSPNDEIKHTPECVLLKLPKGELL